jgi:hypothetical protein
MQGMKGILIIGTTPLEKINREWTRMQMFEVRPRMVRSGDEIHSREFASPKGVFAVQHLACG